MVLKLDGNSIHLAKAKLSFEGKEYIAYNSSNERGWLIEDAYSHYRPSGDEYMIIISDFNWEPVVDS